MKVIINGVTHDNPTEMRIEVEPEGETIGPIKIVVVGGPLTICGYGGPGVFVDYTQAPGSSAWEGGLITEIETPPLNIIPDKAPEAAQS